MVGTGSMLSEAFESFTFRRKPGQSFTSHAQFRSLCVKQSRRSWIDWSEWELSSVLCIAIGPPQLYVCRRKMARSASVAIIKSHRGLYRYKRLPFGIASAPAMFQRVMDTVLQDIPGVMCYMDDIIVTGNSNEEHLRNLEKVQPQTLL